MASITFGTTSLTGYTTSGGGDNGFVYAMPYTAPGSGPLLGLGAQIPGGSGSIRVKLYADSAGTPGALLAETGAIAIAAGDNYTTDISANPTMSTGVQYWIAIESQATVELYVLASGAYKYVTHTFGAGPDPFGTATDHANTVAAYATFDGTLPDGVSFGATGGPAYSAANGTTVAPAYPAGLVAGNAADDRLYCFIHQKPTAANGGTVTTLSGWSLVGELTGSGGYGTTTPGADIANTNLRVYRKDTVTGSESGTVTWTVGGNSVSAAQIIRVSKKNATDTWSDELVFGERTTTPTSPIALPTSTDISVAPNDLIITYFGIPTDVTTPSQFSGESYSMTGVTFGTLTEDNEPDTGNGLDIGGVVCHARVTTGTATGVLTFNSNLAGTLTNVRGPIAVLRIRSTAAGYATGASCAQTGSQAATGTHAADQAQAGACAESANSAASETATALSPIASTASCPEATSAAATESSTATGASTATATESANSAATETIVSDQAQTTTLEETASAAASEAATATGTAAASCNETASAEAFETLASAQSQATTVGETARDAATEAGTISNAGSFETVATCSQLASATSIESATIAQTLVCSVSETTNGIAVESVTVSQSFSVSCIEIATGSVTESSVATSDIASLATCSELATGISTESTTVAEVSQATIAQTSLALAIELWLGYQTFDASISEQASAIAIEHASVTSNIASDAICSQRSSGAAIESLTVDEINAAIFAEIANARARESGSILNALPLYIDAKSMFRLLPPLGTKFHILPPTGVKFRLI